MSCNINIKSNTYSVSELCSKIKSIFTTEMGVISVTGEVSSITNAGSGHSYFILKDQYSQIKCVYFRKYKTNFTPELTQGMSIQVSGQISIYEGRGDLQLIIYRVNPIGEGALQLKFEQIKQKLLSKGIFDKIHKKTLPKFPKKIALITSSKGAAVQDFLTIANNRFPLTQIYIYDTPSQGNNAAKYIIKALNKADNTNLYDAIILTRGGGSLEDLWSFNDENLAICIFNCKTPIISAIGHEIDFTISDFVADIRAATPSAAAEILLPDQDDIYQKIDYIDQNLINKINNIISQKKHILEKTKNLIQHPKNKIYIQKEKLKIKKIQLRSYIKNMIQEKHEQLKLYNQKLNITSVQSTLNRGYAIVKDNKNNIIDSVKIIENNNNNKLQITVKDGSFTSYTKN